MSGAAEIENGSLGRLAVIRLRPNEDLVTGIETACREHALRHAVVRSAVGSLVDASLDAGGKVVTVTGPGIEILTLGGELRTSADGTLSGDLRGTLSDSDARVYGGRFRRGENPICITLELVLQEWVPSDDECPTTMSE